MKLELKGASPSPAKCSDGTRRRPSQREGVLAYSTLLKNNFTHHNTAGLVLIREVVDRVIANIAASQI